MSILMCRPDFFGIQYEINPWMHVENAVDHGLALRQWSALYDAYIAAGETVDLVEGEDGLPDMVFTANAGVIWGRRVVLSNFHHPERQGEEPKWRAAFERLGFEVVTIPRELSFEGAGDALFMGSTLFCGFGFRTARAAHQLVADALDVEVVSLSLIDSHFYHLDTCFCPLDDRTVLIAPEAFAPGTMEVVRSRVERVIEVPPSVAAGFACNAIALNGRVISSSSITEIAPQLSTVGYDVLGLPMTEFMKSGGGVRCLTLPLEVGGVPSQA